MTTKVTMPQLGESVVEGTIGKWLISEGDRVEKDQPIVEILTDKADSEIPSPIAGVVTKTHGAEDDIVEVGAVLCEIDEHGTGAESADGADNTAKENKAKEQVTKTNSDANSNSNKPTSPAVRKLARETNVELSTVTGTGASGRITKKDVENAAQTANNTPKDNTPADNAQATPTSKPAPKQRELQESSSSNSKKKSAFRVPAYRASEGDEIIAFSRRRRIIADHMVYSKQTSPEVVTFAECDLHKTAALRNAHKHQYKKEGVSLTFLSFTLAATARALHEFPDVNARVLDDAYVKLRHINLGIAVDTPDGLVVPVIKNADELTVRGLARSVGDLAGRARDGGLTPDDLSNKTFTVTNPGRKGNLVGGAIISQPNVGILRLGTIKKRVVVVERDGEDVMVVHPVMYMALTYDHRIVDGVNANGFLYRISEILEQGDFEL